MSARWRSRLHTTRWSATLLAAVAMPATAFAQSSAEAVLRRGIEKHPVDALALAIALALPFVAVVVWIIRRISKLLQARAEPEATLPLTGSATGRGLARRAWIEGPGLPSAPVRLGELARIGRSDECEIALRDPTLAETHALIQRTPDSDFEIFDVSTAPGEGLAVNGKRHRHARLRDGDQIGIGSTTVVFRVGRAGETGRPRATA